MDLVIQAALERLGGSPEEVAATLAEEGCKGVPGNSRGCPVREYLHKKCDLPSECDLRVGSAGVRFNEWPPIMLPLPVSRFVNQFDLGRFSFLVVDGMAYLS